MSQKEHKRLAAQAALATILPSLTPDVVVGVGTGSTSNCFIDILADERCKFRAAVSSSEATTLRLQAHDIPVLDLNEVDDVAVYVDGADAVAPDRALVKGGGGALTCEKIVAASARCFVCIIDVSKMVDMLGVFPLPVEIIPMARRRVADELHALGGEPVHRHGFRTDHGNHILDVHGLTIADPAALEAQINQIPGVVENGIFAASTRPQVVLVGSADGVRRLAQ